MTDEEKQLIFKVLSAMLPYHVRVKVWLEDGDTEEGPLDLEHNYGDVLRDAFYYNRITKIRPYLRPMSSMTEEEKKELCELAEVEAIGIDDRWGSCLSWNTGTSDDYFEIDAIAKTSAWLDEKKFDWRRVKVNGKYVSFIKAGLALEAPADMYR